MTSSTPPRDEAELLRRARAIAGRTVAELAARGGRPIPRDLRRAKGWIGELIERCLGANAGSSPEPDFPDLGIEVKTIPIDSRGRPKESTHVCAISLGDAAGAQWATSRVRAKLARVLWVPVEADPALPLPARRIGQPSLWSPDHETLEGLRRDWEEHMEMIATGRAAEIGAERGVYLQVRPKAANGRSRTAFHDIGSGRSATLPLGFYLRASFTRSILDSAYATGA